jgi:hypothetical protein
VRNGTEALAIAQGFVTDEPTGLSALAAAWAENGRFPEAIAAATRALELIRTTPNKAAEAHFAARLEAYRGGKPWHQ